MPRRKLVLGTSLLMLVTIMVVVLTSNIFRPTTKLAALSKLGKGVSVFVLQESNPKIDKGEITVFPRQNNSYDSFGHVRVCVI